MANLTPTDDMPEDSRRCDECGCTIYPGEQANPATMCEAFCPSYWPAVQAEDEAARRADVAPAPADPGKTVRIRNVPMQVLVYGEAV